MRGDWKTIIQRGLLLLAFIWGISVASPVEAYSSIRKETFLSVENKVLVDDGKVWLNHLSDGNGGTITYDEANNILLIDNYTFTQLGVDDNFIMAYNISEYKPFRIVLKGTSTMFCPEDKRTYTGLRENPSISIDKEVIIEGDGKLVANTGIVVGKKLTIKDCDLVVNGVYHGVDADNLIIRNANLILSTENLPPEQRSKHTSVLHVGNYGYDGFLTIENSVVKVKTGGTNWQSVMVRDNDEVNAKNIEKKIVLSKDMRVEDETGAPLNVCFFEAWDYIWYFAFSKEQARGTTLSSGSQISQSVYFISSNKEQQVKAIDEVVTAINSIGTVTLDSGAKIEAARKAYNQLGPKGTDETSVANKNYMLAKVFNYKTLENAEATYAVLQKQEAERLANEEANKAANKGNNETGKGTGNTGNTTVENSSKDVTVNGVKYTIKTPKLKSAKSKKKKMITLTWTTNKNSSGYQISYSTSKKFKKSKTKTVLVKNKKTKTKTIKKLKSKKTYYVRIRGYKTANGKKLYGHWSQVKKVKTK